MENNKINGLLKIADIMLECGLGLDGRFVSWENGDSILDFKHMYIYDGEELKNLIEESFK